MVLRAAQGVLQGPVMPVMFHMSGSWMPNNEKTWLLSFMVSGRDRVSLRKIYRVSHLVRDLALVDCDFGWSVVCTMPELAD